MKVFILVTLAIAAVWDAFTTVSGTVYVLGDSPLQVGVALLFSALILSFNLNTRRIMEWRDSFVSVVARTLWFVAMCYDYFTSWFGSSNLITRGEGGAAETFILIGLTLFVTISPMLLFAIWELDPSRSARRKTLISNIKARRATR